jgi:hypothetical protein
VGQPGLDIRQGAGGGGGLAVAGDLLLQVAARVGEPHRAQPPVDGHEALALALRPGGDEAQRLEAGLFFIEVVPGMIALDDVAIRVDDGHGVLLGEPFLVRG